MKKAVLISSIVGISSLIFSVSAQAAAFSVRFSNAYPIQGDTVIIGVYGSASAPQTATLDGQTANFFPFGGKYIAALGLKVTAPTGWQKVTLNFADGSVVTRWIDVLKKNIVVENLPIPPSLGVTAPQLVQSLTDENAIINKIVAMVTPQSYVSKYFGLPLANNTYITDRYGILRKTGDQEIWHLGTDFAAPAGSVVGAMNAGVVRFATSTFSYGNMVIVDHGEGIYSMYLHMSKILVSVGQAVAQGQVLGLVGDTGFSTGDHLHVSIKVNGVTVDPLRFVNVF
jgi:murein DD-endopeptidase MepM/ murein hydrolase activator NlpD